MDRTDVAYLINTTPKYFYLLPLHLTLLRRYASQLKWPVYLATEAPEKLPPICETINIIPLTQEQEAFLESRAEATRLLPPEIKYVFPIQEYFLLQARPMQEAIKEALEILDECPSVSSMRLMPCPGPTGHTFGDSQRWFLLEDDEYLFTYQATLWKREVYQQFMDELIKKSNIDFSPKTPQEKVAIQIKMNIAEIDYGKQILKQYGIHLAFLREGKQPNAVYLSPWPYRPTAVVKGVLQEWVYEFAKREAVSLYS